jgi:uncharacterized protein (DUF58 family)
MDEAFDDALKIACKKHDLVGLWVYDIREAELPDVGLLKIRDMETGDVTWADTSDKYLRESYRKLYRQKQENMKDLFTKNGIDYVSVSTNEDYVRPLINLFKKRA